MPETTTKRPALLGQTRTVASSVARALEDAGVRVVFGLDDPQAVWHALRKSSIETVVVHDERSAAFMADAYARATGQVGVCGAISGPGGTNLATGLLEARSAHIPVVAMVGEATAPAPGRHTFQSAPHEHVLGPLVKSTVHIHRAEDAYAATRHALDIAAAGTPGPVLLLAGDDFLWEEQADSKDWPFPAREPSRMGGSREAIEEAAMALSVAAQPVIVAGGGVHSAGAYQELSDLATAIDAPVVASMMGKGAIPDSHELSFGTASAYTGSARGRGQLADELLHEADVVLVVGSDLDSVTTSGDAWPTRDATLIRIDVDPAELAGRICVPILADAREALGQLSTIVGRTSRRPWTARAIARRDALEDRLADFDAAGAANGYVWPGEVIRAISKTIGPGDAVVTDASYSSAWVIDRLTQSFAGRVVLSPRGCGVLGWGLPAAIGARIARPDNRVTLVTGDGGLLFTIGELETASRLKLDLTLVLLNNESFGYQRQADMLWQGQADLPDLRFGTQVNYQEVAEGFGWHGARASDRTSFEGIYRAGGRGDSIFIEVPVDPDVRPPITKMDLD